MASRSCRRGRTGNGAPAATALSSVTWTAARAANLDKLAVPGTLANTDNAALFHATGFAVPADLAALATTAQLTALETHGDTTWATATGFAVPADLAALATTAQLTALQTHGDGDWKTAAGFATLADLQSLQSHGDSSWATAATGGLATSQALGAIGAKVEAILEDTGTTGVVMAGYTAPDNAGVAAIKAQTDQLAFTGSDVKATLDGEKVAATLAAQQPAYAPAKAGDPMTLTAEERGAVATALLQLANGIETGFSLQDALRLVAAAVAGLVSGAGSGVERFKGLDKATDRLTVLVDEDGNRTGITYHR